jgi:hypothetical protein
MVGSLDRLRLDLLLGHARLSNLRKERENLEFRIADELADVQRIGRDILQEETAAAQPAAPEH